MQDYFDAPPEGATGSGFGSFERPVSVNYKSGKTPKEYVQFASDNLEKHISEGVVGFYTYNGKDNPKTLYPKFSFILLAAYAGISGKDGEVAYWSNRSTDTRVEPLTVYASNSYEMRGDKRKWKPVLSGLYNKDFTKNDLPNGVKYTTFLVAYCLETETVVEIQCTNAVTSGLENALKAAGQKNTFLLSLTKNDHIWGFTLTGYAQIAKDGQPYAGFGEMFWQPTFRVGLLNVQKAPDLFVKVVALQEQERERHESYNQASKQPEQVTTVTEYPAQPAQTNVRPSEAANTVHVPDNVQTPVGRKEPEPVNILDDDTLPF